MKIRELYFVLFEMIHEDNVVSFFYICEEAIRILSKCKDKKYKYLYRSLKAIMSHVKKIEEITFGTYDVTRLYRFRTIYDYLHDRIASFGKIQQVTEECVWISIEMDQDEEIIFSIETEDAAHSNLIVSWLDSVPDEAYHPFSNGNT